MNNVDEIFMLLNLAMKYNICSQFDIYINLLNHSNKNLMIKIYNRLFYSHLRKSLEEIWNKINTSRLFLMEYRYRKNHT